MKPPASPLRYNPAVEHREEDEAETSRGINETLRKIEETTYKDSGHALRAVHAKSHGLLEGKITVLSDLPPELAQGLFAKPKTYGAVVRFSTSPGDLLDDSVSTPRGVALKILDVEGPRVADGGETSSQDFLMVNGPAFFASSGAQFLKNLKLLAATTDRVEGVKKAVSATFRGIENLLEAAGTTSAMAQSLGGQPETHILGETFYTQTPIRFGDYVAKISLAPASPELKALTDKPLDVNGKPNGLREAVIEYFKNSGGEWDLCAQLCTDLETMPVEDSSKVWPEDKSPYIPIARLVIEPQRAWSEERIEAINESMSFDPWHALEAHRPLGSIMRLRKPAYKMSKEFRSGHNRCPIHEPKSLQDVTS